MMPITLTQQLLAFNTIKPPGNEESAAHFLREILEKADFKVARVAMGSNRSNIVADFPAAPRNCRLSFRDISILCPWVVLPGNILRLRVLSTRVLFMGAALPI